MKKYDYIIIGAGIIGLSIAREIRLRYPNKSICIIEKESDVAYHASGRNSGVLHAGFYYTADSLKAKFTRDGNKMMTEYCENNKLKINKCAKLVVATEESELEGLEELKRRGDRNGVELTWMTEEEIKTIDPNAKTHKKALYSPTTSSVDPVEVCQYIKNENINNGIDIYFDVEFVKPNDENSFTTNKDSFEYNYLINAAGLYADKIAHYYNFGKDYSIIPFKGLYLKYNKNTSDLKTNIYPVPNLLNPFLGTHFTKMVDGTIKIGPTSIPAFWRENYTGLDRLKPLEMFPILFSEGKLFLTNAFNFRKLAIQEIKKYSRKHFISTATKLIKDIDWSGFKSFLRPGIRAQLLNKKTSKLVMDFVLEGDNKTMHVLNAVSPAFTCSFPFASYVVDKIVESQGI